MASMRFREVLDDSGLIDLGSVRPSVTWKGSQVGNYSRVFKRLGKAVCNPPWRTLFENASVGVLPRVKSDHHPILVDFRDDLPQRIPRRPFRFIAAWPRHPEFPKFIQSCWPRDKSLSEGLGSFRDEVRLWNVNVFGNIHQRKRRTLARIGGIQKVTQRRSNPFLRRLDACLQRELDEIMVQEEMLWFQKLCSDWVKFGDRNARYFDTRAIQKRRAIRIEGLKTGNGNWIYDDHEL